MTSELFCLGLVLRPQGWTVFPTALAGLNLGDCFPTLLGCGWVSGLRALDQISMFCVCVCLSPLPLDSLGDFNFKIFTKSTLGQFSVKVAMYVCRLFSSPQCNLLLERDGDFYSKRLNRPKKNWNRFFFYSNDNQTLRSRITKPPGTSIADEAA